ncbi:nuclear transport factor 2 family protein [Streptomyces sp. NPDC048527]|uniref:nuclear transport factor 2 family protein n=1 Tax=Streptomyces sp. NPDC048527 TaxID=3365568 RepID=UPI00371E984F
MDDRFELRQAVLDAQTKAINAGDVPGIMDTFADDVVYKDAFLGQTWRGKSQIARGWAEWLAGVEQRTESCTLTFTSGMNGVSEWVIGGKFRADVPNIAPGMTFAKATHHTWSDIHGVTVLVFDEDNRILSGIDYWDIMKMHRQLGIPLN